MGSISLSMVICGETSDNYKNTFARLIRYFEYEAIIERRDTEYDNLQYKGYYPM